MKKGTHILLDKGIASSAIMATNASCKLNPGPQQALLSSHQYTQKEHYLMQEFNQIKIKFRLDIRMRINCYYGKQCYLQTN
jgi:NaMN:DMB phosphoribosyltransferase